MRIFKRILLFLGAIIALALITALFVKKEYSVARQVNINKSATDVFAYIRYLKNQEHFSKWASLDPAMKKSYKGTDGQPGFVSAWESDRDDVGKGEQEIIRIAEGKRIDYELRFLEPIASTAPAFMTTEKVTDNQTKVTWGFNGKMTYPTNLMLLFFDMERMIGDDFQMGLEKLKTELEQ